MKRVGVIGSGPAALMAADVLSAATAGKGAPEVHLFEKRRGLGRKLLVAGSSGLNISNGLPLEEFARHYTGDPALWTRVLRGFTPRDWIEFIEGKLGIPTFEGTSRRYFIEDMKASRFVQAWRQRLESQGVRFHPGQECVGFAREASGVALEFTGIAENHQVFDAVCFALGGGSWEPEENPLRWPAMFKAHGLDFVEFQASNVGYQVRWSEAFLREAEGKPLKNIVLSSPRGSRKGDAMITRYGIEGTPVYFVGARGPVTLDLKPDLSAEQILEKLHKVRENLSPIRRVKKQLGLCEASLALLYHGTPPEILHAPEPGAIASRIKAFPLELGEPQPLSEAISSSGGLALKELDDSLMLQKFPGVFAAGEMLDWDAPTGGFLLQGCVALGRLAGEGILRYLASRSR